MYINQAAKNAKNTEIMCQSSINKKYSKIFGTKFFWQEQIVLANKCFGWQQKRFTVSRTFF